MSQEGPNPAVGALPPALGRDAQASRQVRPVLERCWELVAESLLAHTGEILNEVMAAAARSGDETQLRGARMISLYGKAVAHAYRGALRAEFDAGVSSYLARQGAASARPAALSLVEMDDSNLTRQISQASARLQELVREPLLALRARLQLLGGGGDFDEADAPLRPAVFVQAASKALASEVSAQNELAALLRHFPAAFSTRLAASYESVCAFLDSKGFAPSGEPVPVPRTLGPANLRGEVPPAISALAADAPGAGPALPPAAANRPAPGRAPAPAPAPAAGARIEDEALAEYGRLQALLGVNAGALLEAARSAFSGAPAQASIAPSARLASAMLAGQRRDAAQMAAIERPAEPAQVPAAGEPAAPAGARAPAPRQAGSGTREISQQLIALAAVPLHKLTIQLVARLFTRMERDRIVAASLREMLLCLRFPFLEVALADPSIFVRPDHPARRLIDTIGTSCVHWSAAQPLSRRYLQHVRSAIQFVVHSPGMAGSAFAQAHAQLLAGLARDEPATDAGLAAAWEAALGAEQRALRAAKVGEVLRELLEGAPLEQYLRDFLLGVWPHVLVEAALVESEQAGRARRLLNVVPDLVWSVQPQAGGSDRKRLVEAIPSVLAGLREGVRLVDWPAAKLQSLLDRLVVAHSQVLKTAEAPPQPAAAGGFSISTLRIRLDGLRIDAGAQMPADGSCQVLEEAVRRHLDGRSCGVIHEWIEPEKFPPTAPDAAQAQASIARWPEQSWFDLRVAGESLRVRLEGYTPAHALALFSRADAGPRVCISRAGLVHFLRCARIAPVEAAPLTARAFRRVLSDLQRAARAAIDGTQAGA